jgi:hypothetical protein
MPWAAGVIVLETPVKFDVERSGDQLRHLQDVTLFAGDVPPVGAVALAVGRYRPV